MGAWFGTFFKESHYQVVICDRNKSVARTVARRRDLRFAEDQKRAIRSSQIIVLATPTQATRKILNQVSEFLAPESLVVEISSVKEPLRRILQRLRKRGVPILSIHPMFGPGAKTLKGRTVLATSIPSRNIHARRILSLFRKRGAKVILCSIKEHEALMSALLTLPHFLNLVMVNTLRVMRFDPDRLRELSGTTFRLQLLIAEAISQENLENEASIFIDNSQSMKVLQKYIRQCNAALSMLKKGKRNRIIRHLRSSRRFLERDRTFSTTYERFNAAVAMSAE